MRIVECIESIETIGTFLGTTVTSKQSTTKENTYFRHHWTTIIIVSRSQLNTCYQILLAVCTQLTNRQL